MSCLLSGSLKLIKAEAASVGACGFPSSEVYFRQHRITVGEKRELSASGAS